MASDATLNNLADVVTVFRGAFGPILLCVLLLISIARRFGRRGMATGASVGLLAFALRELFETPFHPVAGLAISTATMCFLGGALSYQFLDRIAASEQTGRHDADALTYKARPIPLLTAALSAWLIFATPVSLKESGVRLDDIANVLSLILSVALTTALLAALASTQQARLCPPHYLDGCSAVLAFSYASLSLVTAVGRVIA